MSDFEHRFGKPAAVLAVLLLAPPSLSVAQQEPVSPMTNAVLRFATPLDVMPPAIRDAYIRGIRKELAEHGYDAGPEEEAVLGGRLAAAIALYQQDAGLAVDGVASKELLDHLKFSIPKVNAALEVAPEGAETNPGKLEAAPRESAAIPQQESGYDPTQPRKAAGQDLQTGRVYWPDQVTAEPLADLSKTDAPVQEANRGAEVTPDALESVAPESEPEAPLGVVSLVQKALNERGYFAGPVDGVFGAKTSHAVRRFQEDSGLPASGVIDSTLLGVLSLSGPDGPKDGSAKPEDGKSAVNL